MINCARCNTEISEEDCYWQEDGKICATCMAFQERKVRFLQAQRGLAFVSLAFGMGSFFLNPFFLLSIAAIVSGLRALLDYLLPANDQKREFAYEHKKLIWMPVLAIGLSIASIAMTVLSPP